MTTEQRELEYWDWLAEVNQRLTFLRLKALNHKDVSEEDYSLMEVLFRDYDNGEFPLFHTKPTMTAEKSEQISIFDDITTTEPISVEVFQPGIIIDNNTEETKQDEEDV